MTQLQKETCLVLCLLAGAVACVAGCGENSPDRVKWDVQELLRDRLREGRVLDPVAERSITALEQEVEALKNPPVPIVDDDGLVCTVVVEVHERDDLKWYSVHSVNANPDPDLPPLGPDEVRAVGEHLIKLSTPPDQLAEAAK